MPNHSVFLLSDGTGITAETFGKAILNQFESQPRFIRMPYTDTVDKAHSAVRDINHFNSLALKGDDLWLLAHNRGGSEILHFDIPTRTLRSREALGHQAHNLWRIGGRWHTCSSAEGAVVGAAGLRVPTGGFPRGIAKLPQGWAVGISELAERGRRDFTDGQLALFDRHWREQGRHTLAGEGLVLDLLPVCGIFATLHGLSGLRNRLFG